MAEPVSEREAELRQLQELLSKFSPDELASLMPGATQTAATNIGSGAIAQGERATAASDNSLAIGGNVYGDVYQGPAPKDGKEALTIYRAVLAYSTERLSLRGLNIGASDASRKQTPLDLAQVYVDLDTTTMCFLREGKTKPDEFERRPVSALEAVINNRRLVVLGDPGSGKSTFVNRLACGLAESSNVSPFLPGWPPAEANRLPVLVILRDYARSIQGGDPSCQHLWSFIKDRLDTQNLSAAIEPIHQNLEDGKALVMFDGLDEIPTREQRRFVRDAVTAFSQQRYPKNRYLLTCRILSYLEPKDPNEEDLRIAGFPVFTLAPFDDGKIDRFIAAWYHELTETGTVNAEERDGLTQRLQEAVRRPDLHGMAGNPLLLTVMALVHTHKGRLPDARAVLYEDTVDLLLSRWDEQKQAGKTGRPGLTELLAQAGRAEIDLKRVLWRLAFNAHEQGKTSDGSVADIPEASLQKALANLNKDAEGKPDLNWARDLLDIMKLRAGLLIERLPGVFTFPHRTFQEFLAGVYLTSEGDFARNAAALADDAARWREVILLAVGYLLHRQGDTSRPLALAGELCPEHRQDQERAWRRAWLAGDVLAELGSRTADSQLGLDLHNRVSRRLLELVTQAKLPAKERGFVGDVLARLGDPRPEVTGIDAMQFCYVPPGAFLLGSDGHDRLAYINEKPQRECSIPYGYWLARFPVTVGQFRLFVEQTKTEPGDPDCLNGLANHPVSLVSWNEAIDFCRWLTGRWQSQGYLPDNWAVTLPSEAEWEKAARGGLEIPVKPLIQSLPLKNEPLTLQANEPPSRIYPWGVSEADPERMNFKGTDIPRTNAVGAFPGGATPYGAEEMSGNVWEWTRSIYEGYPYPEPGEKRQQQEDLKAGVRRVLRGGAFHHSLSKVRCASRHYAGPVNRSGNFGFRIVVSPCL
ncbi:MAG: SUMF1/EgtB/PvdO family nonheme iron enzyme [Proteobacteria bacterium]|nr:SUMF1/EgtB/PvdO family nonheme iron enzyme [Pseudomonadota bacterium]